ncbi:MAG: TonB-dependent receptor [Bacteroidales bacterium]|nr:TonB-dependent receptor [Bacteroidales bacterium]
MKKTLIITLLLLSISSLSFSQQIRGKVVDKETNKGIPFANVGIVDTPIGTTSDEKGFFTLKKIEKDSLFIEVSFVGYHKSKKYIAKEKEYIEFALEREATELNAVNVVEKRSGTTLNTEDAVFSQYVSAEGIKRLACCSLAESFENNAAVDVGFTDAVTGAKQIQMLGLAGIYSQILVENQPSIRMLSTTYGLNYIPGPWLDGISISKGTSSVTHGYESITGQINIDVKKPERKERFYLEYFTNDFLKQEININSSFRINKYLESIILAHGESTFMKSDRNNDNFLDVPLSDLLIASNRYFFNYKDKIKSRFGVDILYEDRIGGDKRFDKDKDFNTMNYYGAVLNTKRVQLFENTGFLVNEDKNSSIGVNSNFVYHELKSQFGLREYNPTQKSGNLALIYNSDLWNDKNKISFGANASYDNLRENLSSKDSIFRNYKEKEELVMGGFAEYTFSDKKKWTFIAGLRTDYNMFFKQTIITPRLHAKYSPWENSAFRVSMGRGLHSTNILPENINLLATSRNLIFDEDLRLEDAWNYGISYSHIFFLEDERSISFSLDFHRTDFKNRIIIDLEKDSREAHFYNLKGESFANSFQAEVTANLFEGFETTLAYVYSDSRITIGNELIEMPLTPKHKGLLSLHYTTKYERWKYSFTTQYHGQTRLPNTQTNPVEYQLAEKSPDYFILHAQITHKFKNLEIYVGCENILNYKQKNPIISADNPFGQYFDSSIIYAPIIGRQFNLGLRLTIK